MASFSNLINRSCAGMGISAEVNHWHCHDSDDGHLRKSSCCYCATRASTIFESKQGVDSRVDLRGGKMK